MLQQFYKETLQSQYVKYILNNVAIPTVPFTSNIIHVTKGNSYIHDGYFVTAKESKEVAAIEDEISKDPLKYDKYFIKYEPYIFGEFYNGLTTTYKSNTLGYDSETHYYLGEYLRAYKAYYDIDLMPFYNCFSNEYINYIYLNKGEITNQIKLEETYNQNYTVISVPIKFCQTYTIAIQCPHEVRMLPVFVGKKGILEERTKDLHALNYWGKSFSHIDFKNPVYFESPHIIGVNDSGQLSLQSYDKYLRLLIQIPSYIESSIVVLEGKYQNCGPYQERIFNLSQEDVQTLQGASFFKKSFIKYLNQNMISNLSLLQYNNSISYAFCGRLIEYLVNAVISSNEKISKNIKRVQNSISSDRINGIYDNSLRIKTFKSIQEKKSVFPILDFNGFVDKDSERILSIQNEVK